ncbi:SusC/RagA family TonB-linked outer membrane protein [Plebeiibacterium sediminum]|uniref:TonB-dependent receptor n=1 Tax=Plebeiibacterium sediminum TaxID=2992112 RepID=A0AAE3M758_9BACT|nr:TonB-dependent receptor [Plebeiobacterium sediminum]MCW3788531.1 TonB-dependent receptor [Plebeiobacterium sediminum]
MKKNEKVINMTLISKSIRIMCISIALSLISHIYLFAAPIENTLVSHNENLSFGDTETYIAISPGEYQQERSVKGKVLDDTGQPLPGVTVLVKETTLGTITNIDGEFELNNVNTSDILVFSFVGMVPQEITINNQTVINVTMEMETTGIEEVVAIGYGTVKKTDLTGSVGIVKAEALDQNINTNVGGAIQGKIAGVSVESAGGDPSSGVRIQIRGAGSINNVNPLIIVDGMSVSSMNNLNPSDIESIQVLKDASAAAIYGSRASNGVILVTTKSGKKGEIKINVNADYGVQQLGKKLDLLNADEWIKVNNAARDAGGMARLDLTSNPEVSGEGIDWQDEIYRKAKVQNYNIEASGGSDKAKYSVSLGYLDKEGIVKTSNYERVSLRVKTELTKGKLKIGETVVFSQEDTRNLPELGGQGGSAISAATMMIPAFKIYDENAIGGFSGASGPVMDVFNPVAGLSLRHNTNTYYKFLANVYAEYEIIKGLKYKISGGATINETKGYDYIPRYVVGNIFRNEKTSLNESSGLSKYTQIEQTVSYNNEFGKHSVNAVVGHTSYDYLYRQISGSKKTMPDGIYVLDAGTDDANSAGYENENTLLSYLGRVIYSFDNKYILTATYRRDGSSRFSDKNRWGDFPSISGAWNISNEGFFSNLDTQISTLKLRASYGVLGNQEIGDYQYMGLITSAIGYSVGNPASLWVGNIQTEYEARDLKWESTKTSNLGLDVSFWSGKLNFTMDYFNKKTSDVLLRVPIPLSLGVSNDPYANAGKISNKGFELEVNYKGQLGDFKYSVTGSLSAIKNEVLALSTGSQVISGGSASHHGSAVTYTREGYPLYSFFLIKTDGLFRSEAEVSAHNKNGQLIQPNAVPGDIRFVDANDDGIIDGNDRVYCGSPFPDFSYGIRLDGEWKSFDFAIFFQGTKGNKIYNGFNTYLEAVRVNTNYSKATLNSYTFNPDSNFPRLDMADPNGNGIDNSDRFLENGSYFRMKTLQIGYTLPENLLKKAYISFARLYLAADNIFTISDYSGYNPDIGGNGLSSRGVDFRVYPLNRSYHVGLQLNF